MASSSSGGYVSRYDVFLSFRGEDTRQTFTDHLYKALGGAAVYAFLDDNAISRGEDLEPEIVRGIRESRASVIILSENYATSRWCLDELCLILKEQKERNHFVFPIFYRVDPSHVRNQEGNFKIEAKAGTKWTEDKVIQWNEALKKVGNMKGDVAPGRPETDFIKDIVDSIKEKLDLKHIYRQVNLVGMETQDKEINSWLEQPDCEFIAISGIGGCGKTTLARHIAYSNWHKFEGVSILEDIGSKSAEELRQLQERLISDVIQGKEKTIPSLWEGTYTIENALQRKKVLIVLDNIVTKNELDHLLGTGTKTHSKFIITTREKDPSTWFQSHRWRCRVHTMKLLDDDDSLKLLNFHAFKPNAPKEDYHKELAQKVLWYCQGNPLALEVLGSSLNRDSRKQFWESILNSLRREVPGEIQSVLLTSYNSLHQKYEKELFLHIACFFIGKDKDSVEKILEPDYFAISGIVTLTNSSLLFVSPDNKIMMHRLLQEMAKTIVLKDSFGRPGDRSRVCHDIESYDVLVNKKGTQMVEGLALNMELLRQKHENGQLHGIHELVSLVDTNSFERMNNLKLLLLDQLELTGSYTYFSKDLRLLCLRGFHLEAIPSELYMGKLVAIDMSCSKLKVFQPPYVLPLLKILDLRESDDLTEICNGSLVPNLETLILWNCRKLVRIFDTIGDHKCVTLLNITGCENLCKRREQPMAFERTQLSPFGGRSTDQPSFKLPISLERLFAKDTNLEDTDYFPLTFKDQPCLMYLNLVNSPFENLPDYTHLKNLLVLDLSFCSKLKTLLNLPRRLAELYTFHCISLERVTFESQKYTLQEFRYEGCVNLSEVEDFFKLVPVDTLTEADLGHMNWLREKEYQVLEVCLVGDEDLTKGRTLRLQMLYEFNIRSISLPDIEMPNMNSENKYTSEGPKLSFNIPESHGNRKLMGLNLSFKYTLQGDEWVWFAKIRTNNGVDLIYNPKVFGKPAADEVGTWLSYWPIGESLRDGEEVSVSIIVTKGLEINGCVASLVYAGEDEDESFQDSNKSIVDNHESFEDANDFFKDDNEHADILGADISRFKLSRGTYYLCRRDYSQLMEVGRLSPSWFKNLVGDTIDYTEIGGWRKTGRPDQPYRSYTKLKTVGCIIYGPHLNTQEESYKIEELSKSSLSEKAEEYTSEFSKDATKDKNESANLETTNLSKAYDSDEIRESTSSPHGDSAATKEELNKIEELSKSSLSDKAEEYTSEFSKDATKYFPKHLKIELEAIKSATNNFDDAHCIGKGGFGKVYKGELVHSKGRSVVAIKRLGRALGQGNTEFLKEIFMLSLYKHENILSLLGFCDDSGEMLLIYEYASKGSLALHLNNKDLSWVQRLEICIGAARGLAFLHNPGETQQRVLHRDIKSSNILLDEHWNARITDFGLFKFGPANQNDTSLVSSDDVGSIGYLDPSYVETGFLTKESDVYSFGVVLFELLCGRLCIGNNRDERQPLTKLVCESYKQNTIDEIIYGNIKDEINPHSLKAFTTIAYQCLNREPKERPVMTEVVNVLERALQLQVSNLSPPPSPSPAEPPASPNKKPFSSSMSRQQSSPSEN